MKKLSCLFLIIILAIGSSFAIVKQVGGTGADYATLKLAFNDINDGILTGNIVLEIAGNTIETSSAILNVSGVGTANYSDVIIYPTDTVSISGNINTNLVVLNGADHVTIDGRINRQGNSQNLEIKNTNSGANASTLVFINSATHNLVQYVTLRGVAESTTKGVVSFLSAGVGDGNDFNTIQYCDITGVSANSGPFNCIYSNGITVGANPFNDHIVISNNKFYDFYSVTPSTYIGITLHNSNSYWTIMNNSFYQTVNRTGNLGYVFIYLAPNDSTKMGSGFRIENNIFGGNDASGNGMITVTGQSVVQVAKMLTSANDFSYFRNNTIKGITTVLGSLVEVGGKVIVSKNNFGGQLPSEKIIIPGGHLIQRYPSQIPYANYSLVADSNTITGIDCSWHIVDGFRRVSHNKVSNIKVVGGTSIYALFDDIDSVMYNDISYLERKAGVRYSRYAAFNTLHDLNRSADGIEALHVYNNVIKNFRSTTPQATNYAITGLEVHNNYIQCDRDSGFLAQGDLAGIGQYGNGTFNATNNIIHFDYDTLMYENICNGFRLFFNNPKRANIINNTVVIRGKFKSSFDKSNCIYLDSHYENVNVKNNIFVNLSDSESTRESYNFFIFQAPDTLNSDHNNFITNGVKAHAGYLHPDTYTTLASWQSATTQETNTIAVDPNFINIDQGDGHGFYPQSAMNGVYVPSVDRDFFGNFRSNPPKMGAIEIGGCAPILASINPTVCDSFVFYGQTYNSSGIYTQTINGVGICDTIYTINLNVLDAIQSVATVEACGSYTWIDGNTYTSNNNSAIYTYVGGNVNGCDSTVTLNLSINSFVSGTAVVNACGSYTWIDGNIYTSNNNTATYTYVNGSVGGCDSVVTLNLTINNFVSGIATINACGNYTWIDGVTYTSNNNTATFTYAGGSVGGCDSIVTLNLNITNLNTNVTDFGGILHAVDTTLSYQWLDCNNAFSPIIGANSFNFMPTMNGDYAVVLTNAGCTDTSNCYTAIFIGINDSENKNQVTIYPNPFQDQLMINYPNADYFLLLYDVRGALILKKATPINVIPTESLVKGIYFYLIMNKKYELIDKGKLIKQ